MVQQRLTFFVLGQWPRLSEVMGGAGKVKRIRGGAKILRFWASFSALWSRLASLKNGEKLSRLSLFDTEWISKNW